MEMTYPPEAEQFRTSVKAFLAANLPSDFAGIGSLGPEESVAFRAQWRKTLYQNGFLAPKWPKVYGGAGLSDLEQVVLAEEFSKAGVPKGGNNDSFSIEMLGNTLLRWGTDEQKAALSSEIACWGGHMVSGL